MCPMYWALCHVLVIASHVLVIMSHVLAPHTRRCCCCRQSKWAEPVASVGGSPGSSGASSGPHPQCPGNTRTAWCPDMSPWWPWTTLPSQGPVHTHSKWSRGQHACLYEAVPLACLCPLSARSSSVCLSKRNSGCWIVSKSNQTGWTSLNLVRIFSDKVAKVSWW